MVRDQGSGVNRSLWKRLFTDHADVGQYEDLHIGKRGEPHHSIDIANVIDIALMTSEGLPGRTARTWQRCSASYRFLLPPVAWHGGL